MIGRHAVTFDSDAVERAADAPLDGMADTPETLLLWTMAPSCKPQSTPLPDAFRQAVWLRDVEEFSYAEIATVLDVPIGTVMSRISRGRRMLFERLHRAEAGQCLTAGPSIRFITPVVDGKSLPPRRPANRRGAHARVHAVLAPASRPSRRCAAIWFARASRRSPPPRPSGAGRCAACTGRRADGRCSPCCWSPRGLLACQARAAGARRDAGDRSRRCVHLSAHRALHAGHGRQSSTHRSHEVLPAERRARHA